MADITGAEATEVIIADGTDDSARLKVNPDGSINTQDLLQHQVGQDKVFTLSGSFNAATSGADNPIFLIKNPNASGKILRIRKLLTGVNVNNVGVEFTAYYAPTITANGTAQTARNNLIGSATASVTQCFSLPTLSSLGTKIMHYTMGQNSSGPEVNLHIDVQANQNVVIAANPFSNNRPVQLTVIWAEV